MGDKNKNSRNKINTSALKNSGIPDPIAILTGKPGSRITTSPQGISFPSKPEEKTKENTSSQTNKETSTAKIYKEKYVPKEKKEKTIETKDSSIISTYEFSSEGIPIKVIVQKKRGEFVPIYELQYP